MYEFKNPKLFLEIKDNELLFLVVKYNEDFDFEILEKIILNSKCSKNGIISNLREFEISVVSILERIEKKLNFNFDNLAIIFDNKDFTCKNLSGFKKLNGSQLQEEDISYILNTNKKTLLEERKNLKIIHLLNSKYFMDGNELNNIPIGIQGDFYIHQLSVHLIKENNTKNLINIFNKCNLKINKFYMKSFIEGVNYSKKRSKDENFILINFNKNYSKINYFDKFSLNYFENFNFGTEIIKKDVEKVCSLSSPTVENIFCNLDLSKLKEENYLQKKIFVNDQFRKISYKHLNEIIDARISEIIEKIFKKNSNLIYFSSKIKVFKIV